ncbi:MAG: hypothetical protein IPK26_11660 [Planctomycetes bacterium]|nr:hypothetical protein [Planctomycetota bacterium]
MDPLLPPSPRPATWRHVWCLPAAFGVLCALSAAWPGEGWQSFSIGSIAGLWVGLVLGDLVSHPFWPTLLGGMATMAVFGLMLDGLRVPIVVWVLVSPVAACGAGYVLLQGFPDLDAALVARGSWLGAGICALQLGSYVAVMVALAFGAGRSRRTTVIARGDD